MTSLIRIELVKLRTVRASYCLLAAAAALTALFASLEASRAGNGKSGVAPLSTVSGLSTVTTVTGWAMLFAGILGVMVSSGEFRHASATLTVTSPPSGPVRGVTGSEWKSFTGVRSCCQPPGWSVCWK